MEDDFLATIEQMASDGLTADQIALLLDLEEDDFRRLIGNKKSPESKAFRKGITKTAWEIMKKEIAFAKRGSPSAIKNYLAIIKRQNTNGQIL